MKTKKYFKSAALVIFVFFVSWSPLDKLIARSTPAASAQEVDLVDLKKKEEKRKKESKKSKYVVTNENIGNIKVPKKSYGFIKVETKEGKAKSLNDQLPSGEAGSPGTPGRKATRRLPAVQKTNARTGRNWSGI